MKIPRPQNKQDSRTYYEVFGDNVVMLNTFKVFALVLCAIIFFQIYVNLRAQQKPPFVIEVNAQGRAREAEMSVTANEPDELQIRVFVQDFVEIYTAFDSKSVAYDFSKALNFMHSDFQKRAQNELKVREELKSQNIFSKVRVEDIRIEKNVPGWVHVSVSGIRRIERYHDYSSDQDNANIKDIVFNSYLTLAKVPRTKKELYGLLVYDYREPITKELSPPNQGGINHEK